MNVLRGLRGASAEPRPLVFPLLCAEVWSSQAIRNVMSSAEREHYTTVVDYFGGGGCWGLYHALTNFPNANRLLVNEFDPDRLEKIRLLHEIDGRVADEAETILYNPSTFPRIRDLAGNSSSPRTVAAAVRKALLEGADERSGEGALFTFSDTLRKVADPRERAVLRAFVDCASTMLGTSKDESGKPLPGAELGIDRALAALREDGRRAKEAADAYKARGGSIEYRSGDAADWPDAPRGHRVVAVCDPPYYLTADYADGNWSYESTRRLVTPSLTAATRWCILMRHGGTRKITCPTRGKSTAPRNSRGSRPPCST